MVLVGLLSVAASGADLRTRTAAAILHLPHELKCPREARLSELPIELEFTNSSKASLRVDLYVDAGRIAAGPEAVVEIQDSKGNDVPIWFAVSMPPLPQGRVELPPGQSMRVPVFFWNGGVKFPGQGTYRFRVTLTVTDSDNATVTLVSAWREAQVSVTTAKRGQNYQ